MKSILFTLLTLILCIETSMSQNHAQKANLLFVAEFPSYNKWLNEAFSADAKRRSEFCNEAETKVGKVTDKMSFIYLESFDMNKMGEFSGNQKMADLMKKNQIRHTEAYQIVEMNPESLPNKANLFFLISFNDYDGWLKNAFGPDSERRAQFCDESRTKMAKIDQNHAMVILYDFDLTKLWEFEPNAELKQKMNKYAVKHETSILQAL